MRFLIGFVLGCLLVPALIYTYLRYGAPPVGTGEKALPFESMAHAAMHRIVNAEAPKSSPMQPTEANLLAGAQTYREQCASCHGLRGHVSSFSKGMYPEAPQLFEGREMVTDDPPGVTFWKVQNGIRLSGMPAYKSVLSNDQMWQVSLMLAQADKLPDSVNAVVNRPLPN